jgi:SAM-dependent methyltransferase
VTDPAAAEFATYDRLEASHWWFRARRAVLRTLLVSVPDHQRKTVLEIGCGAGGNIQHLFGDFRRRVGLDSNRYALHHAREKVRPGDAIVAGDANRLPLLGESFDCVALVDVLYHRGIRDVDLVLEQANAVLRPGGYILISDGAYDFLAGRHNRTVESARRFTKSRLRSHLQNAGFTVVKATYWGVLLFGLLSLKRVVAEPVLALFHAPSQDPETLDLLTIPLFDPLLFASIHIELPLIRRLTLPFGASISALGRKP